MSAARLLVATWTLLASAPLLAPWLGRDGAALATQAVAASVLVALVPRRARASVRLGSGCELLAAFAAGFASYPLWLALALASGLAIGLAPLAPAARRPPGPALWLCALLASPLFEELLYRGRVLDAIRARLGAGAAIAGSAALFAASHVEPWPALGALWVGLGLGAARSLGGSLAECIALHAGINLAALLRWPG